MRPKPHAPIAPPDPRDHVRSKSLNRSMVLGAVGSIFLVIVFAIYLSERTSPDEVDLPAVQQVPGGIVEGTMIPPILQEEDDVILRTQALTNARRTGNEGATSEKSARDRPAQDGLSTEDSVQIQRVRVLAERLRAIQEGRTESPDATTGLPGGSRRFYQDQLERHRQSEILGAGSRSRRSGSPREDRHQKAVETPPPLLAGSEGKVAVGEEGAPENAHVALLRSAQKLAQSRGDGSMSAMLASLAAVYEENGSENTPVDGIRTTPGLTTGVRSQQIGSAPYGGLGERPGTLHLRPPTTQYEVKQGTSIPAILETAINSDVPGGVRARTTRNVYDSRSQRHLLIPKNSTIVGEAGSEQGSNRLGIVWTRLILPDGRSMDLGGQETKDGTGASGLPGKVDSHFFRRFRSAFLVSMVGAGVKIATYDDRRGVFDRPAIGQVAGSSAAEQTGEVASELLRRGMNVRPTVTIPPGQAFHVYVNQDLAFAGPYRATDAFVTDG